MCERSDRIASSEVRLKTGQVAVQQHLVEKHHTLICPGPLPTQYIWGTIVAGR